MSYLEPTNSGRKFSGLAVAVLLHILLLYALMSGLARQVVEVIQKPLETKIIEEVVPDKPPPPPPPPPPPKMVTPPPPFIPPPEIQISVAPPPMAVIAAVTREVPVAPPPMAPAPPPAPVALVRVPPVIDAAKQCQKPEYPPASLRASETGTVLLNFLIDVSGKVIDSKVLKSSGYRRLDEAARRALADCQFKAGTVDGKPEQSWAKLEYVWKIE